jgi:hypothetical protein
VDSPEHLDKLVSTDWSRRWIEQWLQDNLTEALLLCFRNNDIA